jgi:hypothetical protein
MLTDKIAAVDIVSDHYWTIHVFADFTSAFMETLLRVLFVEVINGFRLLPVWRKLVDGKFNFLVDVCNWFFVELL